MPETKTKKPIITVWRVILGVIFLAGAYATYLRFVVGWSAATNLSDAQPWGMWVGVATLCGVGLSAGGFATAAAVYLLGMERYRPIARAAVLVAFLGYVSVCVGYAYELGLPWLFWHALIYWNPKSVLFDVMFCILAYTTVLTIEVSPAIVERLPFNGFKKTYMHWHHRLATAVVLAGVLLSSMHQSYLGGLFLIFRDKMYPLWYTPALTTMFYLSAIPAGLAMVIITLYLCNRSLGTKVDPKILKEVAWVISPMLILYFVWRMVDLVKHGGGPYLFKPTSEAAYFWLEMALFVFLPVFMLNNRWVMNRPEGVYWSSAVVIAGFITNRVNVSINALERATQANYIPKWPEMAVTVMLVTCAILAFRYAVIYLDILPKKAKSTRKWLANAGVAANA
ncbi:MAG TPA: NrfD/PsrC family molybdoenzyme membrane anchor subunit [Terriglobales bacterium]|nr:NrfD/PsrC family molybdoenzyme membrane anchor subunit [Terriglobales bacterium]